MTKDELIEAANKPVTEEDLIEYRRWKKKREEEFERTARAQHVDYAFSQRSYS